MARTTPSMAKNVMRRALVGVGDPHPDPAQIDRLRAFFASSCAYCARPLVRGQRDAHVDHLVSVQDGGSHQIGNCVLSCSICTN